ncbi:MAG TPA: YbaK/EbsC family protein [Spirochaetota bacterium]|nr:YbaK/EbsC family protein [Spirochaetota bacterium]HPF05340.1 YbaK/EbsC family protein [Spirochaetota bacterium]HPJ41770.1 YbaK/EbsC family protein [Spirochaetota bacterium]HPR39215.1 YbaK/EbsC family protein [Spirochaetota bacterium]HRX46990.1 YbaK/EbsC family protein [Spirochaetota bacterium]
MIPENVQKALQLHGLEALEFEEGSTPTSELAAQKLGVATGQIAKSILMKGKDEIFRMILCAGDRKISTSQLKKLIGVKARMATAEEVYESTGFRPGGVSPFGVTGIDILIDESLAEYETVYPSAGNDASGVPVTYDRLLEITGNRKCAVTVPIISDSEE